MKFIGLLIMGLAFGLAYGQSPRNAIYRFWFFIGGVIVLLSGCTDKSSVPDFGRPEPSPGLPFLRSATEDAVCIGSYPGKCGSFGLLGWPSLTLRDEAIRAITLYGRGLLTHEPKDIADYCPNYKELDENGRRRFYVALMAALAKIESNFKNESKYEEACKVDGKRIPESQAPKGCGIKGSDGKYVVSRGQLQISQGSANSYGCDITDAEYLHSSEVNLFCGARILSRWIVGDGVIAGGSTGAWKGAARYWSPFRKPERIKEVKAKTRAVCEVTS